MKDALIVTALSLVPKKHTSRMMGWAARIGLPGMLGRLVVRLFVWKYRVDLSIVDGQVGDFHSLAQFFVRPLRPGVRPVDPDPDRLVSPVDGTVHAVGTIRDGLFAQAPDRLASVAEMLGSEELAQRHEGGGYAILYLSPTDYHRVHAPCDGHLTTLAYHPGAFWPVFPAATRRVGNLFSRNERLVFHLDTDHGRLAQIMVGAFGVGRMSTSLASTVTNTRAAGSNLSFDPPQAITRAEEVGRFELGSTVILLTEPNRLKWTISPGDTVRLGRPVAQATGT